MNQLKKQLYVNQHRTPLEYDTSSKNELTWFLFFQLRDLRAVGVKFYHVLYPKEKAALLKECKHNNWEKIEDEIF